MGFNKDFIWGVGTASYQIEGGAFEDGRGLSVWDVYAHEPGRVKEGHTGDVACDHYHRYEEDVRLMRELGVKSYRFSVSWSRLIPNGIGEVNQKGIDFYNRLIDCLVANNITPCITLFHWDYPYELEKRGAWLNPDSSEWFREYAGVVARNFGDRVKMYITFNEPQCFLGLGYIDGTNAPGKKMGERELMPMIHNYMLGHGKAVMELRKYIPDAKIGYAPTCGACAPYSDKQEDIDAAREYYFTVDNVIWNVPLWSDPIMLGTYPEDDKNFARLRKYLPENYKEDLKIICQPLDFYGQNIYNGSLWKRGDDGRPQWMPNPMGGPHTDIDWPITPEALYWGPKFLYERYKKPIVITENGMCCHDFVSLDGKVHDPNRIDFTHRYLRELKRAVDEGIEVAGYYHWSIMDNFEWCSGYTRRFGLVYVNFETLERTKKDSFEWYKNVIAENGENL